MADLPIWAVSIFGQFKRREKNLMVALSRVLSTEGGKLYATKKIFQLTRSFQRGIPMKTINRFTVSVVTVAVLLSLASCGGMSARDKSTAIGAGVGGVAGAVLTGGSTVGTVGGAAVGAVIGNQVGKNKK
jgi:osmotically inducible lipoprotein OsmB